MNIERPKKVVADCGGGSWKKDARNREEVTKSRDSVVACGERLDRNQLRSNMEFYLNCISLFFYYLNNYLRISILKSIDLL